MNDGNELFKNNQGLVYYTLKHYYPYLTKDDDAIQTALISLWKASENYREIGFTFSTYAIQSIRRNINRYLKKERKRCENLLYLDSENESTESETYASAIHSEIEDAEFKADYEVFCESLTPEQRVVIKLLLEGYYQIEIVDKLELSRSKVGELVKEIGVKWKTYNSAERHR
ncbi:MAG: sigma-70 family RNA polymerase sigma factor [Sphaerochaetaceae bacterium]